MDKISATQFSSNIKILRSTNFNTTKYRPDGNLGHQFSLVGEIFSIKYSTSWVLNKKYKTISNEFSEIKQTSLSYLF